MHRERGGGSYGRRAVATAKGTHRGSAGAWKKCGNFRVQSRNFFACAAPYFPPQTTKISRKFPDSKKRTTTKFPKEYPEYV